jgi:XRN 5'-3' exonuclease N-terminus
MTKFMKLSDTLNTHPILRNESNYVRIADFECMLIDFNSNIHIVFDETILCLNEILIWKYNQTLNDDLIELTQQEEVIKINHKYYNEKYNIGDTYIDIHNHIQNIINLEKILINDLMIYTYNLIRHIRGEKLKKVFICFDEMPPTAGLNEQKNKRYVGLIMNNIENNISNKCRFAKHIVYQIDKFHYKSLMYCGTDLMNRIEHIITDFDFEIETEISSFNKSKLKDTHIKHFGTTEQKIINIINQDNTYNSYCIASFNSDNIILLSLMCVYIPSMQSKQIYNLRLNLDSAEKKQYLDMNKFIAFLCEYFSVSLPNKINNDIIIDILFSLFIFGNDYLPRIHPFSIGIHFDLVCKIALNISIKGTRLIINNKLNHNYILLLFKELEDHSTLLFVDQYLENYYKNYRNVLSNFSLSKKYLNGEQHHPDIVPLTVTCVILNKYRNMIITTLGKLKHYLRTTIIYTNKIPEILAKLHGSSNMSYLLLIMSRIISFPNSDKIINRSVENYFTELIRFINQSGDIYSIKLNYSLIPKNNNYMGEMDNSSSWKIEMYKFRHELEPYRCIFNLKNIDCVVYNLTFCTYNNCKKNYYINYVDDNISNKEINNIIQNYVTGIEWLFNYYMLNNNINWSYEYHIAPSISSLVTYFNYIEYDSDKRLLMYSNNNLELVDYHHQLMSHKIEDVKKHLNGIGARSLNECYIIWKDVTSTDKI